MTTTTAIVRNVEDMEQRWFYGGGTHRWLAAESETAGGFMLFEDVLLGARRHRCTPIPTRSRSTSSRA